MIVCVCNAISDRELREAVAMGARSFPAVQSSLGVATCCGRCRECACAVVDEALGYTSAPAPCGAD